MPNALRNASQRPPAASQSLCLQVAEQPDIRAAGFVGGDVVQRALQQRGNVGGGVGRGGLRAGRSARRLSGRVERLAERAVDEHEARARADGVRDRLGEIAQTRGALADAGGRVLLLHAGASGRAG